MATQPSLSSVSPTSYASSGNNQSMEVLGSSFVSGDTLTFTDPQGDVIQSNSSKLTFVTSGEIDYQFNDGSDAGTWHVQVNTADGTLHSSSVAFTVVPTSSTVDPYRPYTDATPANPTVTDIVNAALNYVGAQWGAYNCTGLVWAVSDAVGADYYETANQVATAAQETVSQVRNIVPDPGNPPSSPATPSGFLGYVTPGMAGNYGQWTTFESTTTGGDHGWTADVSIGDIVRIPSNVLADGEVHSFIVVGGNQQSGWEVIDNTNPLGGQNPVTISVHTFNNPSNQFYQEVLGASKAYISYFTPTTNTTPLLTRVSPTSYPSDNTSRTMQLFGSNFASSDTLTFTYPDGSSHLNQHAITFVSSSEIDYSFDDGGDTGPWSVQVNTSSGTLHSNAVSFSVGSAGGGNPEAGIDYRVPSRQGTALNGVDTAAITGDGYKFVGEYIGTTSNNGYLTETDAQTLAQDDISIVSIFERTPTSVSYFSIPNADFDASDAITAAIADGQPAGSAIYFTVDYDPTNPSDFSAIDSYFREIRTDLDSSNYTLGIYGPGDVLAKLAADTQVAPDFTWLDSYAWPANGFTGQNLTRIQNSVSASPTSVGFDVDLDTARTSNFGQWGPSSAIHSKVVADFNGDGTSDILWRDNANGQLLDWQMSNGTKQKGVLFANPGSTLSFAGAGDFSGDGTSDILWRGNNGALSEWVMVNGAHTKTVGLGSPGSAWSVENPTSLIAQS